jgi:serine phosphatase RsbU (regulator of sigma subunit)
MTAKFKPTVLTIDDEPLVRESIVAFLEDSGFNVLEAQDGKQGLEVYHEKKPDVILCDLHMPVMSGLDVLATLREENSETPFIVVSGAGVVHDAVDALRLGAWDYIIKPITDMGALEHAINRALERVRLLRENLQYREELERTNKQLTLSLSVLKEDQEAGRNIQFELLPDKVFSQGICKFSHEVMPSLYLSGDFVDYFPIDDTHVGFYIIDVSGHGAPSAFVTVLLKSHMDEFLNRYVATKQEDTILKPAELMTELSKSLLKANLGKYLTMFYGVINTQANNMVYSVAGHFPGPILVKPNERAIYLEGTGFPIGVFAKAQYKNFSIDLPLGSHIVLFSDGILELLEDELEKKEEFLLDLITSHPDLTIDKLKSGFDLSSTEGFPDDITMLVLNYGTTDEQK